MILVNIETIEQLSNKIDTISNVYTFKYTYIALYASMNTTIVLQKH